MSGTRLGSYGLAVIMTAVACTPVVRLGPEFEAFPDTTAVTVVDGNDLTRPELERLLDDHHLIARFHVYVDEGDAERLAGAIEGHKNRVRSVGGDVLMYTSNSGLIATIRRDARYAAPPGAVGIYALRRR